MDIGTVVRNMVKAQRWATFNESRQLSLGELILKLEAMPQDAPVALQSGKTPGHPNSWRGSYDEIAIEPDHETPRSVGEFRHDLVGAIGHTFQGYKGGDFTMGRQTPVWVAEWGTSGNDAVVDVIVQGEGVLIVTEEIDY